MKKKKFISVPRANGRMRNFFSISVMLLVLAFLLLRFASSIGKPWNIVIPIIFVLLLCADVAWAVVTDKYCYCPYCGERVAARTGYQAIYCGMCGKRLPETEEEAEKISEKTSE